MSTKKQEKKTRQNVKENIISKFKIFKQIFMSYSDNEQFNFNQFMERYKDFCLKNNYTDSRFDCEGNKINYFKQTFSLFKRAGFIVQIKSDENDNLLFAEKIHYKIPESGFDSKMTQIDIDIFSRVIKE